MRPQLCHCCVLCVRAHLVVARDEVGEQLRYYARELLGSVAGQGHRSRAQAVGAGETGPRIAMPAKTWFCGGMANHKHSETRRHRPRTCRPSLKQISTRRRALVLCRFACPSGARQRAVPALIGARAFRKVGGALRWYMSSSPLEGDLSWLAAVDDVRYAARCHLFLSYARV